MSALPSLNPEQQAAVEQVSGPVLVLAGAGSGKTGVITRKVTHLVTQAGYGSEQIAAVTFTNKAAREMRSRVGVLLPKSVTKDLLISTFHSLGRMILIRGHEVLGYKSGLTIFDAGDALGLLRELQIGSMVVESMQQRISAWKNDLLDPIQAQQAATDEFERVTAALYGEYQRHLKAYNAVDFDDLLRLPVQLLREHGDSQIYWRNRCRYLLVDEYQDTNTAQYEMLKVLVGARGDFTVVGDDDQSIYAWRGARPENLAKLGEDFPALQVIKLEQNYRSTQRILNAANQLIATNARSYEKNLWSALGDGDRIRVVPCADADDEALRVVNELRLGRIRHGTEWRECAILYRSNHQSLAFEAALREQGIPYTVTGGTSFFERGEVKDVIAYLRLLVNPDDDRAFLRVVNLPQRDIGAATLEKLGEYAQRRGTRLLAAARDAAYADALGERAIRALRQFAEWIERLTELAEEPPAALAKRVLNEIGYRDWLSAASRDEMQAQRRWEYVESLLGWIERMRDDRDEPLSLEAVVAKLCLMDMLDRADSADTDAVQLMTLHAAKGLEFENVFFVGCEEGLLPHRNSIEAGTLEEERRLTYVGITRARKRLMMTYAKARKRGREMVPTASSRFLAELPMSELDWEGLTPQSAEESKAHGRAQLAAMRELLARQSAQQGTEGR